MENRPAPDSKAETKAPRERGPVVIWLSEGVSPITSAGVVALPMRAASSAAARPSAPEAGPATAVEDRAARKARRRAERAAERAARRAARKETRDGAPSSPESEATAATAPETSRRRRRRAEPAAPVAKPARPAPRRQSGSVLPVLPLPDMGLPPVWDALVVASETADDGTFVPPALELAATTVLGRYDMSVSGMTLITAKPDKGGAIWRVETDRGPRSLKLLHRTAQRSLFSVGAQHYLVGRGARVPALVRTRSGELAVQMDGKLWIVTDWIEPLERASKLTVEGPAALCYGLAEFHRHSQGYVPPAGAVNASRLYRWPKSYQKMLTKIGWFREIALAYREQPAAPTVLSVVDMFEQQAREAMLRLDASPYAKLVARGEQAYGIVHQDYGWSNGQVGPGGVWLIDLDGVAFDLPIRDLRKLISSAMDDKGDWDLTWIRGMIDAYSQANPIEEDLYRLLLIDMSLPSEFYKLMKECVAAPAEFLNAELDALLNRLVQVDLTKWQALRELGLPEVQARRGGVVA